SFFSLPFEMEVVSNSIPPSKALASLVYSSHSGSMSPETVEGSIPVSLTGFAFSEFCNASPDRNVSVNFFPVLRNTDQRQRKVLRICGRYSLCQSAMPTNTQ